MKRFIEQIMREAFPRFEPGEDPDGGSAGGITQINVAGEMIDMPAGLNLEEPGEPGTGDGQPTLITKEMLSHLPEGVAKQIEGKSLQEVLTSFANAQSFIGKQGTEIGALKKQLGDGDKRTSAKASKEYEDLSKQLKKSEDDLAELDELVDGDDYLSKSKETEVLRKKAEKLKAEISDLKVTEMINVKMDEKFNQTGLVKMRDSLMKDFQMEFDDETWKAVSEKAKLINGPGEITPEAMESAVIMTIGTETYRKTLTSQGEMNMREKLSKASKMEMPLLDGSSGKGKQALDYNKLPGPIRQQVVNALKSEKFLTLFEKTHGFDLRKLQ